MVAARKHRENLKPRASMSPWWSRACGTLPHMSTWPDELDLELTGMAQGGDAVGHHEGRAVFAAGGLPGERVHVRLYDRQKAFAKGHVIDVLHAASERRTSPCPLETTCGAADWRWIDQAAQLRFKQQILHDQLTHLGGLDLADIEIGATTVVDAQNQWGYRTTAELHIAGGTVGYFAPTSRRVVPVPACCLHHPLINTALAQLQPLLDPVLPLSGVTIRCVPTTGEVLAVFEMGTHGQKGHEGNKNDEAITSLRALARAWQAACVQTDAPLVGVVYATRGRQSVLVGRDWLTQRVAGVEFQVGARSFFQINAHVTPLLVERVQQLLAPRTNDRLLDVFCGVGTFALPLARQVRQVVGVETFTPAIADARRSAQTNAITNVAWHVGAAEQVLPRLREPFDAVVLDPPRRGCEPAVLEALLRVQPERMVYVSCHPGTLARDLKHLVAGGYRLTHAQVIDLFPQTHHVESIVRLEPRTENKEQ